MGWQGIRDGQAEVELPTLVVRPRNAVCAFSIKVKGIKKKTGGNYFRLIKIYE